MIYWLHPYEINTLTFGFEPNYYYQVKLRWMMGMKFRELDSKWPYNNGKTPRKASRIQALFNNSHVLYYILLLPLFIPAILEIVNLACASCKTK